MSNSLRRNVAASIAQHFAATDGGEDGLTLAVGQTIADHAAENVPAEGLYAIEDAIIGAMQQVRGRADRDPLGLVLTPPETARAVALLLQETFPAVFERPVTLLDPACGTGRLLTGALETGVVADQCVGWDVDPVVLALGNGLASLRARAGHRANMTLREQDGFLEPRPTTSHPVVVVSNPPFVAAYARRSFAATMDREAVASVQRGWSSGALNTAVAFVARIVRDLLRPGEVAAMIVPDALLTSSRYAMMRAALIEHVDAMAVGRVAASTFEGRGVRTVVLAVRRAAELVLTAEDCRTRLHSVSFRDWNGTQWEAPEALDIDAVLWSATTAIPWPSDASKVAFELARQGYRLSDRFTVHDGVNPGSAEAREALISETPSGFLEPRPLVEGKDIHAGEVAPPRLWIEADRDAVTEAWRRQGTSLRRTEIFVGPRLYSRQTTDRLICGFVDDGSMAVNSAHVIRWNGSRSSAAANLRWLCAVLCTRTVTELYQALFAEDRALFPQVKVTNLRAVPLPWPPPLQVIEAAERWFETKSEGRFRHVEALTERWLNNAAESSEH